MKKVVKRRLILGICIIALLGVFGISYIHMTKKNPSVQAATVYGTLTHAKTKDVTYLTTTAHNGNVKSENGKICYSLLENNDAETVIEEGTVEFESDGSWVYKQQNKSDVSGSGRFDIQQIFQKNKDGGKLKVKFCNGEYRIFNLFRVYSNTIVCGEDKNKTILTKVNSQPTFINFDDSVADIEGYNGTENFTLEDITFNCLATSGDEKKMFTSNIVYMAHGSDVDINNIVVKNGGCGHAIQLTSMKNVNVTNCTFKNLHYKKYSDNSYESINYNYCVANGLTESSSELLMEVIQIESDFITGGGDFSCPTMKMTNDNTPSKNIVVSDCYFHNVIRAIGNHTAGSTNYQENVYITDNYFGTTIGTVLSFPKYKNLVISDNYFKYTSTDYVGGYRIHVTKSVNELGTNYTSISDSMKTKWCNDNYYWSDSANAYKKITNKVTID